MTAWRDLRVFRLRPFAIAATVLSLLVTAVLSWAAYASNNRTEDRLLRLKVDEAGTVLQAAVPQLQTALTSVAEFAGNSNESTTAFRGAVASYVGTNRLFASASLWQLTAGPPRMLTAVGVAPKLASEPAKARSVLTSATTAAGVSVVGLFTPPPRRIGYAYAVSGPHPVYVVYAESSLPADGRVVEKPGTPFSELHFALYLGRSKSPSSLLEASVGGLGARTASTVVPFGDTSLTLVASAAGPLGGSLANALWWIVAAVGGALSLAVGAVTERLLRRRLAAEALTQDVQRLLADQRNISETLQLAMVPPKPPAVTGLDIAVRYLPGAAGLEIGGDWYDVIELGDGRTFLSIGDVSGRGVQAGAVMSSLRSGVRAFVSDGHPPGKVLAKVSGLLRTTARGYFATMLCAVLDRDRGELRIACAGHLPPLLIAGGTARLLDVDTGPPVGVLADPPDYREQVVELPASGRLLLFTDGLVERPGEVIDDGLARLRDAASHAPESIEDLLSYVSARLAHSAVRDDTAMLGVRW